MESEQIRSLPQLIPTETDFGLRSLSAVRKVEWTNTAQGDRYPAVEDRNIRSQSASFDLQYNRPEITWLESRIDELQKYSQVNPISPDAKRHAKRLSGIDKTRHSLLM